ncbi:MAG: hypothetical protein ACREBU_23930 [Nitrososphaera sp.]
MTESINTVWDRLESFYEQEALEEIKDWRKRFMVVMEHPEIKSAWELDKYLGDE